MSLTNEDRAKLQKYRRKDDRAEEPVFVGREDLFRLIEDNAAAAADGDDKGRTVCLAGPPGIGKTAFLSALKRRAGTPTWDGPPVSFVKVSAANLHNPGLVLAAVASQLPEGWRRPNDEARGLLGRITGAGVDVSALGFTLSASATWDARQPEPDPTMPWARLAEIPKEGGAPDGAVVCLLVDEAHSLKPTPGDKVNWLLHSLHKGPEGGVPLPAFAVLAGHTHTPDVLERSISRRLAGGNEQYMQSLSEAESLRYVEGTLSHLGVSGSDPGRKTLAHWIVTECGGFPHHLRNAMGAVAEGLLRTDGLALSSLDGGFIEERLRLRREAYYDKRTQGSVGQARGEFGALLRKWSLGGGPPDKAAGAQALQKFLKILDPDVRTLMPSKNGAELMDEMVQGGVLVADRAGGGCRCPIDSLIAWMEGDGKQHVLRSEFPRLPASKPRKEKGSRGSAH